MTAAFLLVAAFACPDDQKLRLDLKEWKAALQARRRGPLDQRASDRPCEITVQRCGQGASECEAPEVYVYARAGGKYVRK